MTTKRFAPAIESLSIAENELIEINGLLVSGEFIKILKQMLNWELPGESIFQICACMRLIFERNDEDDPFDPSFVYTLQELAELFKLYEAGLAMAKKGGRQ